MRIYTPYHNLKVIMSMEHLDIVVIVLMIRTEVFHDRRDRRDVTRVVGRADGGLSLFEQRGTNEEHHQWTDNANESFDESGPERVTTAVPNGG